jgi:hypothetical protein
MEGVNILTDGSSGVFVEGAEQVIEMYEKGEIDRDKLYESIMDLDVVFKSKNSVESSGE